MVVFNVFEATLTKLLIERDRRLEAVSTGVTKQPFYFFIHLTCFFVLYYFGIIFVRVLPFLGV